MLTTLLIANRGEIACRVMRTAKAMGLTTVAVHSAVDADARHTREADIRIDLGGAKPADSYLRADKLIEAARASGAQAIHPGYGFLSENAEFARACETAGLIFLGPPASAIEAMGSKSAAKALMEHAGVPLVPGYHGEAQDPETFRRAAEQIGYPVLLKAAAGGGGKGMKIVEREADLVEALQSAQREAQSSFGDARMLVEKYLLKPRHVEIQVFADQHGHCLYLNERDCSIQRRHQKVVEEAPAPGLSVELRRAMGEAAVKAAQAIGYVGAGTVEFLLDARGEFFFMEMNTRLQVEHPVTEAITGLDLVAWQIRIARGEPLPITQAQVPLNGHAIEVRLYAEDPDNDFLPATGTLDLYREAAAGPGRRVDSGVAEGDSISPFYDPMLGKLIAWGENREEARLRLLAMLDETCVGGIRTNLAFLRRVIGHPAFAAAELDTGFIPRHEADLMRTPGELPDAFWQLAAKLFVETEPTHIRNDDVHSPWAKRAGLRLGMPALIHVHLSCNGECRTVRVTNEAALRRSELARETDTARPIEAAFASKLAPTGGRRSPKAIRQGPTLYLEWNSELQALTAFDPIAEAEAGHQQHGGLSAPMNGSIVRVLVEAGQSVEAGSVLIVMEAMKMEHSIRAAQSGLVKSLFCHEGEMVSEGAVLLEMEAA
ncbi:acetyl-CoA carboxylase, biotin carboxylase [Stutzerimonas stutzeri DSM 10701]|uniref:acetyl/propionyl/methylcrotonyl-CoA carboxylase subunit alpha n=1 Tax=Stutzerimonas nitrititolerans TaxID=2482751 RepID=UPI00026D780B|nr:acetyl/propionyl/methylcrotonyl-CoA carboxylase subunit alpha [Stutzerimonas nitrititolerans]AFN78059.1 acetyl-CoA carboxylase, biotin carboxylase [Stutzerimonas stutzeri DSM 10701]NNT93063.1 acetyl/propionyl/methylcrotonyl-CoA carboxylase subunit alpha [Stutzerimonas nitrititolerans]SUD84501.1 acetyl-CoA carboxylase, biotin carboxylase [Stutzerimonas stutzeri]